MINEHVDSIPRSSQLRIAIDPASFGFRDTSVLLQHPLSWIGQERAERAARFGLNMMQPDYHLFVLGEEGSGRSSLLHQMMQTTALNLPVPPDLCYLHNFIAPEKPLALRLPAGQGRVLRQSLLQLTKSLQTEITQCLGGQDFKLKVNAPKRNLSWKQTKRTTSWINLPNRYTLRFIRNEQIVFTLLDEKRRDSDGGKYVEAA